MATFFNKNRDMIAGCFTVILAVAGLMGKVVLRECAPFAYHESFVLWKPLPCTLSPLLVAALLAAFFSERGYVRETCMGGVLLMLAATVVQIGSSVLLGDADEPMLVSLYGYSVRKPFAFFLVATGCLRGGAAAVLVGVLSGLRHSGDYAKAPRLYASAAVCVTVAGIWLILLRLDLQWLHVTIALFLYMLMLIPVLLHHMGRKENATVVGVPVTDAGEGGWRRTLLWLSLAVLCVVTVSSFWRGIRAYWMESHLGHWLGNYMAMTVSSVVFAIGLLVIRNKRGKRNLPVFGASLLLVGYPLVPACLDVLAVELLPQAILGTGLALVLGPALVPLLKAPVRAYATTWVGAAVLVAVLGKGFEVLLNRVEAAFHSTSMALYCVYPLAALLMLLLGYLLSRERKGEGAGAGITNP